MKIETTTSPSHATMILRGDFETDAAGNFLHAVTALEKSGTNRIMVSFRYVKYINSTGLGAVVRARSHCREHGGDLVILRPSRLTHDVITKMGLDSVLKVFDDEDLAADYLAGEGQPQDLPKKSPAGAPSAAEPVVVMFSFADERAKMLPGKSRHGVGVLDSVDATTLVFRWNAAQFGCDASTAAALFAIGSTMRNKLQIKLMQKEFFEADSTIQSLSSNSAGDSVVTARWSRLADADRQALERYRNDLGFLRQQAAADPADKRK